MPYTYDANAAADRFLRMLWDHHAEAGDSRNTAELLGYVAMDLISAFQREGVDRDAIYEAIDYAFGFSAQHPATPRPGYFDPEPEPPTYDEALAAKCDADARMDEARKLKGIA